MNIPTRWEECLIADIKIKNYLLKIKTKMISEKECRYKYRTKSFIS